MKKSIIRNASAFAVMASLLTAALVMNQAAASTVEADDIDMPSPMDDGDVDRTVEDIDNGIVITITSDDPDTVKMLQEYDGEMHGFMHDEEESEESES